MFPDLITIIRFKNTFYNYPVMDSSQNYFMNSCFKGFSPLESSELFEIFEKNVPEAVLKLFQKMFKDTIPLIHLKFFLPEFRS